MKSALECLRNAERCDAMAKTSSNATDRRALAETAVQWRTLAAQTPDHEKMTNRLPRLRKSK